jgi:predicted XRE-type DNA-binding protein
MTKDAAQKTPLVFYRSGSGKEPVREWLKALDAADRLAVGQDLMRAQWRWPVGMPLCRAPGARSVGNQDGTDQQAHRTGVAMPGRGRAGGAACLHQEDTEDTRRRIGLGAQAPEGIDIMSKRHHGSSLDSFLKEEGSFEEAQALAIKEVVVWQLMDAMERGDMSKARLAALLKTSRSQVDRLLDPTRDVTLSTLQRAAALVGRKVQIELV